MDDPNNTYEIFVTHIPLDKGLLSHPVDTIKAFTIPENTNQGYGGTLGIDVGMCDVALRKLVHALVKTLDSVNERINYERRIGLSSLVVFNNAWLEFDFYAEVTVEYRNKKEKNSLKLYDPKLYQDFEQYFDVFQHHYDPSHVEWFLETFHGSGLEINYYYGEPVRY